MNKASRRGFSLIELMIAVAIIGIIAGVAYPSYQNSVRKAKRAEGRAALMRLMQQEEQFYSQKSTYSVFSSTSTNADEMTFKWYSGDNAASSAYEISAAACTGDTLANCVLLTARPGTANVDSNYTDSECGNLTLSSTGEKGPSTPTTCWQ